MEINITNNNDPNQAVENIDFRKIGSKITINYTLEQKDVVIANFEHLHELLFDGWLRKTALIVIIIGDLLFIWTSIASKSLSPIWAMAPTLFFICFILMLYINSIKMYNNMKEPQKNIRYTFAFDGYDVCNETLSAQISWGNLLKAKESKHNIKLYSQSNNFSFIPKRCINTEELKFIREILKANLGDKAKVIN
jgi:hypothetical protein